MRGSTAGLAEGIIKPPANLHAAFLILLDYFISSLIFAPAVITYWRGTWNLMGHFLFNNNLLYSALSSMVIGYAGHLVFNIYQDLLKHTFNPDRHRITFFIVSRLYTVIYGIVCVNGWRGIWVLLDIYLPANALIVAAVTFSAALLLAFLKCLRNIAGSPFTITTDHSKDYFHVPTKFKKLGTQEPGLYILDCMFSVLVIGSLVVFVWRGLWVLCDLKLYPNEPARSAWSSLAIGYGIVGVTFSLQSLMRWTCDRLQGIWRVIAADIFLFFGFIGTVNVWRGVWQLIDVYFLPNEKLFGDLITHSVSFLLLALLNCSNSVLVRGVYIDAEEPAGQCVIFPVYYIRLFFQKERTKKQKKLIDALGKIDTHKSTTATSLLIEKPTNVIPVIRCNNNNIVNNKSDNDEDDDDGGGGGGGDDGGMGGGGAGCVSVEGGCYCCNDDGEISDEYHHKDYREFSKHIEFSEALNLTKDDISSNNDITRVCISRTCNKRKKPMYIGNVRKNITLHSPLLLNPSKTEIINEKNSENK